MTCSQCQGIEAQFDAESVRKELLFYGKDGPDKTTLWLVEAIKERGLTGGSLLDIGGGIGAIQHELLKHGLERALHIDGSSAYIDGAKKVAKQHGLEQRIEWRHGDFVDEADELGEFEVVTLDRVICCYDDVQALVSKSAQKASQLYGVVYPLDRWYTRLAFRVMNLVQRLRRHPFRVFVHPTRSVEELIGAAGLEKIFQRQTLLWQVALFAK